ncbi:hypothetical protein FRC09_006678 [Ceratobasidium sp. 395]|nr:hypothetical protein FRC09_006678 [Ceratobasidium sp. 395]
MAVPTPPPTPFQAQDPVITIHWSNADDVQPTQILLPNRPDSQAAQLGPLSSSTLSTRSAQAQPAPRYEAPPQIRKSSVPPARWQSLSVPTIRRDTPDKFPSPVVRLKRKIHPLPLKGLPYTEVATNGKRAQKCKARGAERGNGTANQLRHCMKILIEFHKKLLYQVASPFCEPMCSSASSSSRLPWSSRNPPLVNKLCQALHSVVHSATADAALIAEELRHGVSDLHGVFRMLGAVLKQHSAPMHDRAVEMMVTVAATEESALSKCIEILEVMKLDIANHQLQALRPYLFKTVVEFELKTFQERHEHGLLTLTTTEAWLRKAALSAQSTSTLPLLSHTLFGLIFSPPTNISTPPPPTTTPLPPRLPHIAPPPGLMADAPNLDVLYMLMLFRQLVFSNPSGATTRKKAIVEDSLPEANEINRIWEHDHCGRDDQDEGLDDLDEEPGMGEEEREEQCRERRCAEKEHRKAMGARSELAEIDAGAWDKIFEVFGGGTDYDWALDDENLAEEYKPDPLDNAVHM